MSLMKRLFGKKEAKIIHDLASKPKVRKRAYAVWKCSACEEEFHYQSMKCPICAAEVREVKKFTTFVEYPVTKYLHG